MIKRVFLIVLDSFGIGEMPDSHKFGDSGSNTLAAIVKSPEYNTPFLKQLGLFNIDGVNCADKDEKIIGSYARLSELSMGKDTTVGHWEIAGVITEKMFPTYPNGFPTEVLEELTKRTEREILCNKPYSGTQVIDDYGQEHMDTGKLIVYTSADSVFQIAAHEEIVPIDQLYKYCEIARSILTGDHGVARVIARPFVGEYPNFTRTANRHDFSLAPSGETMLDILKKNDLDTIGIGKIYDIFAGKGISESHTSESNSDGMSKATSLLDRDFHGLAFINLVDFDMKYGHRNDVDGYARAATEFDAQLGTFISKMREDDLLIITADHGCDPSTPSTDHSREYTPLLVYGQRVRKGINLGTRSSFADIAATITDVFNLEKTNGQSFKELILE